MLIVRGRILFQAKFINISYRYRGNVARSHIQRKDRTSIIITEVYLFTLPAKKREEEKILNNKIMPYSAIKIKANKPEAYSVLNPDTSSDSPSAKSKGVRLVSATQEISHKIIRGLEINVKKTLGVNLQFFHTVI